MGLQRGWGHAPNPRWPAISAGVRLPQLRVRRYRVEVLLPGGEHRLGLQHGREQRLAETLIPQPSIETLDECVLRRLPASDVVPLLRPARDRGRGQLRAVVADHRQGLAAERQNRVKRPRHPGARQRSVGHQRQAFAREVSPGALGRAGCALACSGGYDTLSVRAGAGFAKRGLTSRRSMHITRSTSEAARRTTLRRRYADIQPLASHASAKRVRTWQAASKSSIRIASSGLWLPF